MKVGTTTAAATSQGLTARRATRHAATAAALMAPRGLARRCRGRLRSVPLAQRVCVVDASMAVIRCGCSTLAGVGAGGGLFDVDVRHDRQADEQRILVGVVVGQLDADRQALHDLDEVAGGVLRRQQRQRRAGAHREAGNASLERAVPAVHVDFDVDALADAQVGDLRFLEVGVDPDFGQRADRHQRLAGLHVVARVDVAARDHAVDLGVDVAVAQVQLGLLPDRARPAAAWPCACLMIGASRISLA